MDGIVKVFQEQWIYMLLAALIIAVTFIVKKQKPDVFKEYCKATLVLTTVAYAILAILFSQSDHFLLLPIIIICCELFGYVLTGKVVGILFVDFILTMLLYNVIPVVDMVENIIFIALQVLTIAATAFVMDKHIKVLQTQKMTQKLENKKKDEILIEDESIDDSNSISYSSSVDSILDEIENEDKFN